MLFWVKVQFWWKFMQFAYDVDRAPVTRSEPSYLFFPGFLQKVAVQVRGETGFW
jgi:hypothetical protein